MFTVTKPNGKTRQFPSMREAQKHVSRIIHCWPGRDVVILDPEGRIADIWMQQVATAHAAP